MIFSFNSIVMHRYKMCRFHSLCAYMGDDDMFSSDLSEDQLRQRLGHMSTTQCQVLYLFLISIVNSLKNAKFLSDFTALE
jgi:hypothetical protein